jgi:1-deoxy-D-xylulose-5-phosphate synthase
MKPAVAIYSTFLQRAYDPIIHDIALQKLPVHFFLDRAGFVGADGATHHGVFDISYLRCIPNLIIMAPKDENELQHMVKTSFDFDQPTAVRYPRGAGFGIKLDEELKHLELGKAEIVYPESISRNYLPKADFAIFAVGAMVHPAIKAAQILSERGFSPIVVNARYIKPLDETLISDLAERVSSFFTVEENALAGGFGSAIFEFLSTSDLEIPLHTLGIPDRFFDHAAQSELRAACGLDPIGILQFVEKRISVRTRIEKLEKSQKPAKPKIVDIITH